MSPKKKEVAPHSEAGVGAAQPAEVRPWPPTESTGVSAAVQAASLPPLTLNVSGEGGLAPRKDTKKKKKDPAAWRNITKPWLAWPSSSAAWQRITLGSPWPCPSLSGALQPSVK